MPHYLLIHGGAMTGRFWDLVVPHLDGPALAVDLPGRADKPADLMELTVERCVASVLADASTVAADGLVVVAHSSGGLLVPGVVEGLEGRVRRIVLSAASVPPEGGCGLDCMKAAHRERTEAAMAWARREGRSITSPGTPEDPETQREAYGERLDDEQLRFVVDPVRFVRESLNVYFQPVWWSKAAGVPVTYAKNLRDRPVPLEIQEAMIERLPDVRVVALDRGHVPQVTAPEEFASIVTGRRDQIFTGVDGGRGR